MQDTKKHNKKTTRPQNAQGIINETYFLLLFLSTLMCMAWVSKE